MMMVWGGKRIDALLKLDPLSISLAINEKDRILQSIVTGYIIIFCGTSSSLFHYMYG